MDIVVLVVWIIAAVLFTIAAFLGYAAATPRGARVNFVALGLAFLTVGFIFQLANV